MARPVPPPPPHVLPQEQPKRVGKAPSALLASLLPGLVGPPFLFPTCPLGLPSVHCGHKAEGRATGSLHFRRLFLCEGSSSFPVCRCWRAPAARPSTSTVQWTGRGSGKEFQGRPCAV